MVIALGVQIVREFAPREIWVPPPHQHKITTETPVLIQRSSGFNRSMEFVIGPNQGDRSRGVEELGVRGRLKKLIGILGVEKAAMGGRNNLMAPEARARTGMDPIAA